MNKNYYFPIIYITLFTTLATWIILSHTLLSKSIQSQEYFASVINASGMQRMISQKSALLTLRYEAEQQKLLLVHIEELAEKFKENHQNILSKIAELDDEDNTIQKIYEFSPAELNKKTYEYLELLEQYQQTPDSDLATAIKLKSAIILPYLDHAVKAFENRSQEVTAAIQEDQFTIMVAAIITLVLELLFIAIPINSRFNQYEELLVSEKNRFERLLKHSTDAVHIIDINGKLIEWSDSFAQMLEYKDDEMENFSIQNWEFHSDKKNIQQRIQDLLKIGKLHFRSQFLCKSGKVIYVDVNAMVFHENDETFIYASARDITVQLEQESKIALALDENLVAYWEFDFKNNKALFSDAGYRILGYQAGDPNLRADNWGERCHPEDLENSNIMFQKLLDGELDNYEIQHRALHRDGHYIWLNVKAIVSARGEDGLPLKTYGLFSDISSQKELEHKYIRAKEEAVAANEAKSCFLSNMSHEIRTPLNGIIGLTDLVLKSELTERQQEFLLRSQSASKALLSIVNDILDYSKIEAGKLEIFNEPFPLKELLIQTTDLFNHQLQQKNLEFNIFVTPGMPNEIIGDSLRISQILNNLVGNAIKFTPQGSVSLEVHKLEEFEDSVILKFAVVDSGIGMNPSQVQKIFAPFEQADNSTTKKYGGTGLGLAISKTLVEMMDGQFNVNSRQDEGSVFSFTVQLGFVKNSPRSDILFNNKARKLLVVVEDLEEQKFISDILISLGLKHHLCSSSEQALTLMPDCKYDTILTEFQQTQMNGIELQKIVMATCPETDFIQLTNAHDKKEMFAEAQRLDVTISQFIEKPVNASVLFETLFPSQPEWQPSISDKSNDTEVVDGIYHILLVEDNETNQIVETEMLLEMGFRVTIANHGLEAVEHCQKTKFDLILMDIQMPVMDGFEAVQKIRTFDQNTPIFALSAAVLAVDIENSKKVGMQKHLGKPIGSLLLLESLKEYFPFKKNTHKNIEQQTASKEMQYCKPDELYLLFKRNPEKVPKLFQKFATALQEQLEEIDTLELNSEEMKQLIHKIKGSSANLIIDALSHKSAQLETLLNEQRCSLADIDEFKNLCRKVIDEIQEHFV